MHYGRAILFSVSGPCVSTRPSVVYKARSAELNRGSTLSTSFDMPGKFKGLLLDFIESIPESKLTGFSESIGPVWETTEFRLDMQGVRRCRGTQTFQSISILGPCR